MIPRPLWILIIFTSYATLSALGQLEDADEATRSRCKQYMQTPEFEQALATLMQLAERESLAVMCAEAVPWRCHRSLIADALILKGWRVRDILTAAQAAEHKTTPFLVNVNGQPTYPDPNEPASLFHKA